MCIYCLITCKCIGQIYYIKSNYLYSICIFNCYLCKSYVCDNFAGSCMGCVSISRGSDQISAKFLKMAAPIIVPALTQIFNLSISKAEFPSPFKLAIVVPIHKKGPKLDYTNYRPISVLPITLENTTLVKLH